MIFKKYAKIATFIGKKMEKSTFLIVGKHAVMEALRNPNRKVFRIFLTEDSKKKLFKDSLNTNIIKDVKIFYKTKKELDRMCGKDQISHQGLIAEIGHLPDLTLKDFVLSNENKKNTLLVALDEVTDPRNIGSIIRSAAAFNIDGIIVKERSYPEESKLMYKSASGCTEHINIFKVSNINTAMRFLKSKNFWVCAFDQDSKKNFTEHDWNGNFVLLFGSEGQGIKKKSLDNSDFQLSIKINENVESLNISNASSIIFQHLDFIKKNNFLKN